MMRRRRTLVILGIVLGLATLLPAHAAACELTDPGCYIDDVIQRRLWEFARVVWAFNRAALIIASWLEQGRDWMILTVMVDAFTALTRPVLMIFALVVILAWLVFLVSFFLQALIELRWVDLRRASRVVVLAAALFFIGGVVIRYSYEGMQLGASLMQETALTAVGTASMPTVPTINTGDLVPVRRSIYANGVQCDGVTVPPRPTAALALNDYAAGYLWADAPAIHCQSILLLAPDFTEQYFPYGDDISDLRGAERSQAVGRAAQGVLRQLSGGLLALGAIVEQAVQMLFAVAVAVNWFSLLLTLVFAVFTPTEVLLTEQIQGLFRTMRAYWVASFLIGVALGTVQVVADSGNGFVMMLGGLAVGVMCFWQGRQAIRLVGAALGAMNTVLGSAPAAVGRMAGSWAATAGAVAVLARQGNLGETAAQIGAQAVRRAGAQLGDGAISRAGGRVVANQVAQRLDTLAQEARLGQQVQQAEVRADWYQRGAYAGAGDFARDVAAVQQREQAKQTRRSAQAQLLDRRAERAQKAGRYDEADRLRAQAQELRDGPKPTTPELVPLDVPLDVALANDPALRQVEHEHVRRQRNNLLRAKRFGMARRAGAQLKYLQRLDTNDVDAQLRAYDESPQHYAWSPDGKRGAPLDGRLSGYATAYPETPAGAVVQRLDQAIRDIQAQALAVAKQHGRASGVGEFHTLQGQVEAQMQERADTIRGSGQRSTSFPVAPQRLDAAAVDAQLHNSPATPGAAVAAAPAKPRRPKLAKRPDRAAYPQTPEVYEIAALDAAIVELSNIEREASWLGANPEAIEMQQLVQQARLTREAERAQVIKRSGKGGNVYPTLPLPTLPDQQPLGQNLPADEQGRVVERLRQRFNALVQPAGAAVPAVTPPPALAAPAADVSTVVTPAPAPAVPVAVPAPEAAVVATPIAAPAAVPPTATGGAAQPALPVAAVPVPVPVPAAIPARVSAAASAGPSEPAVSVPVPPAPAPARPAAVPPEQPAPVRPSAPEPVPLRTSGEPQPSSYDTRRMQPGPSPAAPATRPWQRGRRKSS
ncbi:MAG TPA: hypothetical protein VFS21_37600 [Roseiflexaceae bacterium]|nr:hypothetical protein [Roseiflexaceae bacterium]